MELFVNTKTLACVFTPIAIGLMYIGSAENPPLVEATHA
jgi:hypothetical protein